MPRHLPNRYFCFLLNFLNVSFRFASSCLAYAE